MTRALIFGVTGQDGSYLADHLLGLGYEVYGTHRRTSLDNTVRIDKARQSKRFRLLRADLTDPGSVAAVVREARPREVYNLADQDNVGWSEALPRLAVDVTYGGVLNVLEAVGRHAPHAKVFQPVSATMFAGSPPPQTEESPHFPQSPYAVAKCAAYHLCRYYRAVHGLGVSTGILFNHDSERRGGDYLLQRLAVQAVEVARGRRAVVTVFRPGDHVDVGYAPEFVAAFHRVLHLDRPTDLVLGTGRPYSVGELAGAALAAAGVGDTGRLTVADADRPAPTLIADPRKAREAIDWDPREDALSVVRRLVRHYLGVIA